MGGAATADSLFRRPIGAPYDALPGLGLLVACDGTLDSEPSP